MFIMKGFAKKAAALVMSFAMLAAYAVSPAQVFAEDYGIVPFTAGIDEVYTCDFMSLVKENAQTAYGTENDKNIQLDEYTMADLSYAGTYVTADGKVYLKGRSSTCAYTESSYIEFTAPCRGTVTCIGENNFNYSIDGGTRAYKKSLSQELDKDQVLRVWFRVDATAITSLTFEPDESSEPEESPDPNESPEPDDGIGEYTSPSTAWDFDEAGPSKSSYNKPVISGTAVYDSGNREIKFPFTDKNPGYLTVDLTNPIKATPKERNVKISFSIMNHTTRSGTYVNYKVLNSEGETIVSFQAHPYSYDTKNYPVTGIVIGSQTIESSIDNTKTLWSAINAANTDIPITTEIDYYARKARVTVGTAVFEGDIPESTMQDVKAFEFSATRTAVENTRYLSLDDLKIEEFTSTASPASEPEIANGYEAVTDGVLPYRIARPEASGEYPLVVYLHSSTRNGADNVNQLYQAQYLFNQLKDKAVLAAPQTADTWNADTIAELIGSISNVNADKIYLAGQGDSADAALAIAAAKPDKIAAVIAAAPTAALTDAQISALSTANTAVYAFAEYSNANIENIRTNINKLQSAKMTDVMYTEYPFAQDNVAKSAAETTGITDWLLARSKTANAGEKDTPRVVDLVLFAGQSNMAGRGEYDEATKCLPGHGFEYHPVTEPGVLTTVSEPFGKYENNYPNGIHDAGSNGVDRRNGDMVSSFMEKYYEITGTPIVGVQSSHGGKTLSYFRGKTDEMIARYTEAEGYLESNGYTVGKKFLVWCQGESDADNANLNLETYKSDTEAFYETLRKH